MAAGSPSSPSAMVLQPPAGGLAALPRHRPQVDVIPRAPMPCRECRPAGRTAAGHCAGGTPWDALLRPAGRMGLPNATLIVGDVHEPVIGNPFSCPRLASPSSGREE